MALTSSGDGVYHGVLNEHWTIGAKIHGGAMLALCANAARVEFAAGTDDSEVEPIAVSGPVSNRSGRDIRWRISCTWPTAAISGRR